MDPAPGNVYGTDLSFMDVDDSFYTSLLASTDPITTTIHSLPGHLLPGVSFGTYQRPHQTEAFRIYDETCATGNGCDFNSSYQSYHPDWTTMIEGTWDVHAEEGFPSMTPAFDLDSVGEDTMVPLSGIQDLQSFFSNAFEPCMIPAFPEGSPGPCDAVIQAFAAEGIPWDVFNSLRPGFDGQSTISQSVYDDTTPMCQWCDNGSPCNMSYPPGKDLKHSISQHLNKVHNLSAGGKSTQRCLWLGCTTELKQESVVRHIIAVHLRVKSACEGCGTSFARPDSLRRHMKKSCGVAKEAR